MVKLVKCYRRIFTVKDKLVLIIPSEPKEWLCDLFAEIRCLTMYTASTAYSQLTASPNSIMFNEPLIEGRRGQLIALQSQGAHMVRSIDQNTENPFHSKYCSNSKSFATRECKAIPSTFKSANGIALSSCACDRRRLPIYPSHSALRAHQTMARIRRRATKRFPFCFHRSSLFKVGTQVYCALSSLRLTEFCLHFSAPIALHRSSIHNCNVKALMQWKSYHWPTFSGRRDSVLHSYGMFRLDSQACPTVLLMIFLIFRYSEPYHAIYQSPAA